MEDEQRMGSDSSLSTPETQQIPISLIEEQKLRLENSKDLNDLTESLSLHGQLSPILVRPSDDVTGKYEIVFGNRRFTAARKLGWRTIEAHIVDISKSEALVLAFSENSDREDFSDYERALLLQRIHETTGKKYKEIANLVGRSAAFVTQHIAMLHLFAEESTSAEERQRVLSSLTEGHARVLAKIEDPIDRWNTAKLSVASNMGVRELARMCSRKRVNGKTRMGDRPKTVPELIDDILKGTSSKDVRPFSESVCPRHFTMFSSFGASKRMGFEQALDHVTNTVRRVETWDQQIEDLAIRFLGNVSYATLTIKHQMKNSSAMFKARTRATLIFEKEDGTWKCTHGHWSSVDPTEQIRVYPVQKV